MKFRYLELLPCVMGLFSLLWLMVGYFGNMSNLLNISHSLSYLMVFLTLLLFYSYTNYISKEMKSFFYLILFYLPLLILFFLSENILMFYMLFELSILPIFLMILGWGSQPERLFASNYLLFYTLLFSFPLVIIFMVISFNHTLYWAYMCSDALIWLLILIPFFVKIPIYMFHLWLPKAHVEAPVLGSMILASILLKTGGYGLLKVMNLCDIWLPSYLSCFSLFLILWASVLCILQTDLKKFVAYSSITHMTIILVLMLSDYLHFEVGSIFLMISHGVISNSLFFMVGLFSMTSLSRLVYSQSNMMLTNPTLWFCAMLILFLNAGTPPSLSMINEIMLFINSHLIWGWNLLVCSIMFLLMMYYPVWFMSNMNSCKTDILNNVVYLSLWDLYSLCFLPFSVLLLWINTSVIF
uniref:NADH-ubiquinone oxidoreductase chain 4 n=1 Tax=Trichuris ovis TaxID=93034 RepID=J3SGP5_9BILA|nr:NADH dehydrogenase subunit 4 [Trichuris ovis]AFK81050.1 NADH dehydrogenase subunit 4 [Trichuris ovis]